MIKWMVACLTAVVLMGCVPKPIIIYKPQLVEVPVPYVPKLTPVIQPVFLTSLLTEADINDPGKVAQAYRVDNLSCKDTLKIYQQRDRELDLIRSMIEEQSASIKELIKSPVTDK